VQDGTNGRCDISAVEVRGGDLIEEGLENVMVLTVDQENIDRDVAKTAGRGNASETTTNDHDARANRAGGSELVELHRSPSGATRARLVPCKSCAVRSGFALSLEVHEVLRFAGFSMGSRRL